MGVFESSGQLAAVIAGAAVLGFLCELALSWAATALVDAEIGLGKLSLFTLVAALVSGGAYAPLHWLLYDPASHEVGKFPWTAFATLSGVGMVCSVVVYTFVAWPLLGVGLRKSALVGIFASLLRVLLYSLITAVVMVALASMQIYHAPSGPRSSLSSLFALLGL